MRKKLKRLRLEHALTQEEMAQKLGFTRVGYAQIELGKSSGSIRFLKKLKQEFPEAVDIDDILENE